MPLFGLDLSHYQSTSLDLAQCRREGVGFVFIKSSEGSTFIDPVFTTRLAQARAAGQLVAAYHYVRSNATAAAQVACVQRVVPRDVPVIPDVEANSGGVALVRDFVTQLQAAGYKVPFTYLPRWYWQQIGSPSLVGLPSLWSSRYPDNVVGDLAAEYDRAPASYWTGYGGIDVAVLQFTSSARVAGNQPLDANAYRGDLAQLAALLGGEESHDMATVDQIASVLDGYYVRRKELYGDQDSHDLGRAIADIEEVIGDAYKGTNKSIGVQVKEINEAVATLRDAQGSVTKGLTDLATKVDAISLAGIDVGALAAALLPTIVTRLADEFDLRARDNDPNTGPRT